MFDYNSTLCIKVLKAGVYWYEFWLYYNQDRNEFRELSNIYGGAFLRI